MMPDKAQQFWPVTTSSDPCSLRSGAFRTAAIDPGKSSLTGLIPLARPCWQGPASMRNLSRSWQPRNRELPVCCLCYVV